jgi:hypothetical protein
MSPQARVGINLQSSLPVDCQSPIPLWLPDETFFSLISRYHVLSGNRLAEQTAFALFGHRRHGNQHDFPSHLGDFVDRTGSALGNAEAIACDRSILPFYLSLRTKADANRAISALTGAPAGMLKYQLGILTSRFRAHHPLKACPACMDRDAAEFGSTYWHREHQFPGVWVCPLHQTALLEASVKSTGVERFGWSLPRSGQLRPATAAAMSNETVALAIQLAQLVKAWSALPPDVQLDAGVLSRTYRQALPGDHSCRQARRAHAKQWAEDFCSRIAPLRVIPELAGFPATPQSASLQIDRWIFNPRGNTHPLRHLSLILWLFPNWESFWRSYLNIASLPHVEKAPTVPKTVQPDSRRPALIDLLLAGQTVTAAARAIAIDVNTAMAWAAKAGIAVNRRPKTLKSEALPNLVEDLHLGLDKAAAAQKHSVSIQTITRILRSEVGLQATWHAARLERDRTHARQIWTSLVQNLPGIGTAALRAHNPAAYAWLYRNDRDWLRAESPPTSLRHAARHFGRVDWDSRDVTLSAEVRSVSAEIAKLANRDRVALWQIYQAIPALKAKLGALEQLPLTSLAIQEVTRTRQRRTGPTLI